MNGFPGVESYNMMSFPYPNGLMMYPNMNTNCSINNDIENKIKKLDKQIENLQNRVSRLEGSLYPQAVDYNTYSNNTYQSMR